MTIETHRYHARLLRVQRYIGQHLEEPLTLEQLSQVACFSAFHFHRQFTASVGVTPSRYIQLMRLRKASYLLVFSSHLSVTDIALQSGFSYGESFSRAFKQVFHQSPIGFRRQPNWEQWHRCLPAIRQFRSDSMQVEIIQFPSTPVAMITHQGSPLRINDTAATFMAWRKTSGLSPVRTAGTFGIAPDDPTTTEPQHFRFHICGEIEDEIAENNAFGVVNSLIPGGRCARLRHQGSHDALTGLATQLYRDWLPQSGEALRHFPLFFHYHNIKGEVAEEQLVTDILLPIL